MIIYTIKDLKDFIKDLPNDMEIVGYRENMETHGYQAGCYIKTQPMRKVEAQTYDRFDYTPYSYEVYVYNADGKQVLTLE